MGSRSVDAGTLGPGRRVAENLGASTRNWGTQRDLSLVLVVSVAAAWLDASVHVFSRSPEAAPDAWAWMADLVNFWVGALIRVLIITPLVLVHAGVDWRGWRAWRIWDGAMLREILVQAAAIAFALWIIFGFKYTTDSSSSTCCSCR